MIPDGARRSRKDARRGGAAGRRAPGFWFGVGLMRRGFALWRSDPAVMLLGLVPGVIAAAIVSVLIIALAANLESVSRWIAGFGPWEELAELTQVFVAIGLIWAAGLTIVYGFTSLTLLIGQPFFEAISRRVDDRLGPVPSVPGRPWLPALLGNIGERLVRLVLAALASVGLFLLGLVPLVGAALAGILGLFLGGWVLALELTDYPFERRGHRLRYRRYALANRRRVTLGFGVAAFLVFLVPGGAVLAMSAGVAGGTLLTRHALGEAPAQAPAGEPSNDA